MYPYRLFSFITLIILGGFIFSSVSYADYLSPQVPIPVGPMSMTVDYKDFYRQGNVMYFDFVISVKNMKTADGTDSKYLPPMSVPVPGFSITATITRNDDNAKCIMHAVMHPVNNPIYNTGYNSNSGSIIPDWTLSGDTCDMSKKDGSVAKLDFYKSLDTGYGTRFVIGGLEAGRAAHGEITATPLDDGVYSRVSNVHSNGSARTMTLCWGMGASNVGYGISGSGPCTDEEVNVVKRTSNLTLHDVSLKRNWVLSGGAAMPLGEITTNGEFQSLNVEASPSEECARYWPYLNLQVGSSEATPLCDYWNDSDCLMGISVDVPDSALSLPVKLLSNPSPSAPALPTDPCTGTLLLKATYK